MAEFEELKLSVTLDDQATAKLDALKRQVAEIGDSRRMEGMKKSLQEAGEHVDKLQQKSLEFTKTWLGGLSQIQGVAQSTTLSLGGVTNAISGMQKGWANVASSVGTAGLAVGGFAASMVVAGVILNRYLSQLSEYAKGQADLGKLGERLGVEPAQIKSIRQTYARSGLPQEAADEDVSGISAARADLAKKYMTERVQKALGGIEEQPGDRAAKLQRVLELSRARSDADYLNIVARQGRETHDESLRRARARQGGQLLPGDEERASASQQGWLQLFGAPHVGGVRGRFTTTSDAENAAQRQRSKDADDFIEQTTRISEAFSKMGTTLNALGIPKVNEALQGIADRLTTVANKFDEVAKWLDSIHAPEWLKPVIGKEAAEHPVGTAARGYATGLDVAGKLAFPGTYGAARALIDLWQMIPGTKAEPKEGEREPDKTPEQPRAPRGEIGPVVPRLLDWFMHHGEQPPGGPLADQNKAMSELSDQVKKLNDTLARPDAMARALGWGDIGGGGRPTYAAQNAPSVPLPSLPPLPPLRKAPLASTGATPPGGIAGGGDVNAAINATAGAAGVDPAHWKAIASIESDLDPGSNRYASTQYKGLFQVGARGAGSEWARTGEGDVYNAMDNARSAARLAQENAEGFRKAFGRDPTVREIYLMHQQGLGFYTRGAMTNIGGNLPPSLQRAGITNPTHEQFEAAWGDEIEKRAARYRAGDVERAAAPRGGPSWTDLIDPATGRMGGVDRSPLYRAMQSEGSHKVEGTGKLTVDVNAPAGTTVEAESGGLFKELEMNRQMQMERAMSSARRPSIVGPQ
jgi:hypothetical protein